MVRARRGARTDARSENPSVLARAPRPRGVASPSVASKNTRRTVPPRVRFLSRISRAPARSDARSTSSPRSARSSSRMPLDYALDVMNTRLTPDSACASAGLCPGSPAARADDAPPELTPEFARLIAAEASVLPGALTRAPCLKCKFGVAALYQAVTSNATVTAAEVKADEACAKYGRGAGLWSRRARRRWRRTPRSSSRRRRIPPSPTPTRSARSCTCAPRRTRAPKVRGGARAEDEKRSRRRSSAWARKCSSASGSSAPSGAACTSEERRERTNRRSVVETTQQFERCIMVSRDDVSAARYATRSSADDARGTFDRIASSAFPLPRHLFARASFRARCLSPRRARSVRWSPPRVVSSPHRPERPRALPRLARSPRSPWRSRRSARDHRGRRTRGRRARRHGRPRRRHRPPRRRVPLRARVRSDLRVHAQ